MTAANSRFAAMLFLGFARPIQFTSLSPEDLLNSESARQQAVGVSTNQ